MADAVGHLIPDLLLAGSLEAYSLVVGDDIAARVYHYAQIRTPEELRPSWPMVIAWQRMQLAYEHAHSMGLYEQSAKVAMQQARMLKDVAYG